MPRVFVAGGTGVVGRRVVPALLAAGHEVTVLVRTPERAELVRRAGAVPVHGSLLDPEPLARAVDGQDVVVNLATSIPPFSRAALPRAWRTNDRIRARGSRALVDAAWSAGARRYVQESIAFLYADRGADWIDEGDDVRPTSITASALEAENQARRLLERDAEVVVLRFGSFYGPDSGHTLAALRLARLGLGSTPGPREGFVSSLATDDAATAVLEAAGTTPSGTYNVVDDDPLTREELDAVLAATVGRTRLRPMPGALVRVVGEKLDHVSRSHRVSNRALRAATGWAPQLASIRVGLPATADAAGRRRRADGR